MAKHLSENYLLREIEKLYSFDSSKNELLDKVLSLIERAPAADVIPCEDAKRIAKETVAIVAERQHAFWSRYDKYGHYDHYNAHCSNCDYEIGASGWPTDYETRYCPSCGCRMDAPKPDNGLPDR